MKKICAWCNKLLNNGDEEPITHGMCAECFRKMMKKNGLWDEEALKMYLKQKETELKALDRISK